MERDAQTSPTAAEPRVLVPPTVTFVDDVTYFIGNTEGASALRGARAHVGAT